MDDCRLLPEHFPLVLAALLEDDDGVVPFTRLLFRTSKQLTAVILPQVQHLDWPKELSECRAFYYQERFREETRKELRKVLFEEMHTHMRTLRPHPAKVEVLRALARIPFSTSAFRADFRFSQASLLMCLRHIYDRMRKCFQEIYPMRSATTSDKRNSVKMQFRAPNGEVVLSWNFIYDGPDHIY